MEKATVVSIIGGAGGFRFSGFIQIEQYAVGYYAGYFVTKAKIF